MPLIKAKQNLNGHNNEISLYQTRDLNTPYSTNYKFESTLYSVGNDITNFEPFV